MKNKKLIFIIIIMFLISFFLSNLSFALTLPFLKICAKDYAVGDKMDETDTNSVEVGKTIQMYGYIVYGNDVYMNDPSEMGIFVDEKITADIGWSSANTDIATIDGEGLVTGVSEGETEITATYDGETATYQIKVLATEPSQEKGLFFYYAEPGPAMILGTEEKYSVGLKDIPETEKENIQFSIANETIAKITKVEYDQDVADAIAYVKYLDLGKTKLTATLEYEGETYSASYDIDVVEIGIRFLLDIPGPGMVLNTEERINVILSGIPQAKRYDITFKMEDERIAKVTNIDYESNLADAVVTIKYLKVGKTKLTATIEFNEETYTDTLDIDVIKSNLQLILTEEDDTELPNEIKVGDSLQLKATVKYIRGSLVPKDITEDVTWKASNDIVATVTNGLVEAKSAGTAIITATYSENGENITENYIVIIKESTEKPAKEDPSKDPGKKDPTTAKDPIPQTGQNVIIFIISSISIIALSIVLYKRNKKLTSKK